MNIEEKIEPLKSYITKDAFRLDYEKTVKLIESLSKENEQLKERIKELKKKNKD